MCTILSKYITKVLFCAFLLFSPSFLLQAEETTEYITMTVQEWNDFKTDWIEQMTELAMLKQNLSMLTLNSNEQREQAERLLKKCNSLEMELGRIKISLNSAKISLAEAKKEINECKKELELLKKEIDELKHKLRLAKRQRDAWAIGTPLAFIAGFLVARN